MRLFHITTRADADAAAASGTYTPAAFAREGFIHCSYDTQVVGTANRLFHGRDDLVLLEIDRDALTCPVIDENLEGGQVLYPHVYGVLPMSAVAAVHPFPCDGDGRFDLPAAVRTSSTA
ncbi:MAG TPA: DUF952 domain-containing protein [Vicinamibacterales bacterium]|nr:DUF952 domain-containing protein [Vicinamibacterales bacterium]